MDGWRYIGRGKGGSDGASPGLVARTRGGVGGADWLARGELASWDGARARAGACGCCCCCRAAVLCCAVLCCAVLCCCAAVLRCCCCYRFCWGGPPLLNSYLLIYNHSARWRSRIAFGPRARPMAAARRALCACLCWCGLRCAALVWSALLCRCRRSACVRCVYQKWAARKGKRRSCLNTGPPRQTRPRDPPHRPRLAQRAGVRANTACL